MFGVGGSRGGLLGWPELTWTPTPTPGPMKQWLVVDTIWPQVVNVAVVNEDSTAAMVASLKAQLEKVTHQSEQMREREAQHLAKIDALQALPKGSGGGAKTTQGKSGQEDTIDKVLRDKLVDMKARFEEERRQWRKERDTLERRLQGSSGSYELKAEFEVVRAARDSLQRALAEAELREQALKKQLAARDQELQQVFGRVLLFAVPAMRCALHTRRGALV